MDSTAQRFRRWRSGSLNSAASDAGWSGCTAIQFHRIAFGHGHPFVHRARYGVDGVLDALNTRGISTYAEVPTAIDDLKRGNPFADRRAFEVLTPRTMNSTVAAFYLLDLIRRGDIGETRCRRDRRCVGLPGPSRVAYLLIIRTRGRSHMNRLRSETGELAWLIKSRRDVQKAVVNIMELGIGHKEHLRNDENAEDLGIFASLVGASFGLWRSAFLLSDSARNPNLLADSLTFARHLVLNNAVGYTQDVATHDWSAGYYLNNSVLRLNWVLSAIEGTPVRKAGLAVGYDLNVHRPKWKGELRRLRDTVSKLNARLGQPGEGVSWTRLADQADHADQSASGRRLTDILASRPAPSRSLTDLHWIVKSRSDVLFALIDLIKMPSDHQACFSGNHGKKYVRLLALLIGAGYGLWRSGYLLSESAARPNLLTNAMQFLDFIVRNNTIGNMQDMSTPDWAGGHYLTNATLRLNLVMSELAPAPGAQDRLPSFKLVIRREEWGREFDRLKVSIRMLKEQLVKEGRGKTVLVA